MSESFINKDQIVRDVAPLVGLSIKKTNDVLEDLEELIAKGLKTRKRVIIGGFGSFYLITMRSHTIKSIGTKTPRLLVEQNQIKFRTAKEFRFKLTREKTEAELTQDKAILQEKTASKKSPFVFRPLSIMARVEKDKIKKNILERMLKIAREHKEETKKDHETILPTRIQLKEDGHGKTLGGLIKYATANNIDNIHFSLGPSENVDIFHSRPRVKLTSLPTQTVKNFLNTYFELEDYGIPQERDVRFHLDDAGGLVNIKAFSLPTENGISLYFKITRRKI